MQKVTICVCIATPNTPKEEVAIPLVRKNITITNQDTLAQINNVAVETSIKAQTCAWREMALDEEKRTSFELKLSISCSSKVQPDFYSVTVNTIPCCGFNKKLPDELSKELVTEVQRIVALQIVKAWVLLG